MIRRTRRRLPCRALSVEPLESRQLLAGDGCVAEQACEPLEAVGPVEALQPAPLSASVNADAAAIDRFDPRHSVPAPPSPDLGSRNTPPVVEERIQLRSDPAARLWLAPAVVSAPPPYLPAGSFGDAPREPADPQDEASDTRLQVRLSSSRAPLFPPRAADLQAWETLNARQRLERLEHLTGHASQQDDGAVVIADLDGDARDDLAMRVDGQWLLDLNHDGRWDADHVWARYPGWQPYQNLPEQAARQDLASGPAWVSLPPRAAADQQDAMPKAGDEGDGLVAATMHDPATQPSRQRR